MKTPHKHAELIKAWADGESIQFLSLSGKWEDTSPTWSENNIYRIKPEPIVRQISVDRVIAAMSEGSDAHNHDYSKQYINLTFEGNDVISVELVKNES